MLIGIAVIGIARPHGLSYLLRWALPLKSSEALSINLLPLFEGRPLFDTKKFL